VGSKRTGTSNGSSAKVDAAMERYAAGDDAAFLTVYDALAPRLMTYLLKRTEDPADAADVLQETMLHVHRARSDFIGDAAVAPWAFAIARRLLVDAQRQKQRRPPAENVVLETCPSQAPGADEVLHARELSSRMERTLAELPARQRTTFELTRGDGLSLAQAAEILGTTVGAAKLRLHRAYDALRSVLYDPEMNGPRGRR
jgi:RNA polymerase sigma factor (sigma-70 family)